MIIKDLSLINFGKFNHKSISLEPGINIVYGENEAGKTTLHTFIRAMLFGIEKSRGRSSGRDTYTKYEPWDDPSNYQGIMRIECGGKDYRIERNFNKEHKKFCVVDEDAGRELSKEEIDRLFEGLDENCYYNTISIGQMGSATDRELEVILKNYAANLNTTRSTSIDIKAAYGKLDTLKKDIASKGNVKEEEAIQKRINSQKEWVEDFEFEQAELVEDIEKKKSVLLDVEKQKEEISKKETEHLEELVKKNERRDALIREEETLTGEADKYKESLEKISKHREGLEEQLKNSGIGGSENIEKLTEKTANRSNMPVVFIILMMACIGVALGFTAGNMHLMSLGIYWREPLIFLGGAVIFAILAIVRYMCNASRKKKTLEKCKEIRNLNSRLNAAKSEELYTRRQLESRQEALNNTKKMLENAQKQAFEDCDFKDEKKEIDQKLNEASEDLSRANLVLEQQKEKEIEAKEKIQELEDRKKVILDAKEEMAAIDDAKSTISLISDEIREDFGRELNQRASKYMSMITGGKYDRLSIDEKLNISINGKRTLLPSFKMSKGTIEQIYMALRLAATDIIFKNDKKPILLDDAFAMYDNRRMANTMEFMSNKMEQVIIFSCHTREKVMADRLNIPYNFIRL